MHKSSITVDGVTYSRFYSASCYKHKNDLILGRLRKPYNCRIKDDFYKQYIEHNSIIVN